MGSHRSRARKALGEQADLHRTCNAAFPDIAYWERPEGNTWKVLLWFSIPLEVPCQAPGLGGRLSLAAAEGTSRAREEMSGQDAQ